MSLEILSAQTQSFKDSAIELIGNKYKNVHVQSVNFEVKQDKYEAKIAIITDLRLIIAKHKPLKIESSIHYGDIVCVKCQDTNMVSLVYEPWSSSSSTSGGGGGSAPGSATKQVKLAAASYDDDLSMFLRTFFEFITIVHHYYPIRKTFSHRVGFPDQHAYLLSPCGNFTNVYRSKCDQSDAIYHEDVAWDINTLYNSADNAEFILSDFENIPQKQMIPLLAALEHNFYFKTFNLSNVKLTNDHCNELLKVLKSNITVQSLNISNTGVKSDYVTKLFPTLHHPHPLCIKHLDLSNNLLEDKGLTSLCTFLSTHNTELVTLNLASTSLTYKGINQLGESLCCQPCYKQTLSKLDLSGNLLKGDDISLMHKFLAEQNRLRHINISGTDWPLDTFFSAAARGCTQYLQTLNVSNCAISRKQAALKDGHLADSGLLLSWKQFFTSVSGLSSVDFSNVKMNAEAVKCILDGLQNNTVLSDIKLILIGCQLGQSQPSIQIFTSRISTMKNVTSLDISDNGLDQLLINIVEELTINKSIKQLFIGSNVITTKPRWVHKLMEKLVTMLQDDRNRIETISLKNMKIKSDLTILFDALAANDKLTSLDVSENGMGDAGARILSKALMLNRSMLTLALDGSQLTHVGFEAVASAFERNTTLRELPIPLNDVLSACKINQQATDAAIKKIESSLRRNQTILHFEDYRPTLRFEQWMSNTFDQELLTSGIRELSELLTVFSNTLGYRSCNKLLERAIENCRQVLLDSVAIKKFFESTYQHVKSMKDCMVGCEVERDISNRYMHFLQDMMEGYGKFTYDSFASLLKNKFKPENFHLTEEEFERTRWDVVSHIRDYGCSHLMRSCYERLQLFSVQVMNYSLEALDLAAVRVKMLTARVADQIARENIPNEMNEFVGPIGNEYDDIDDVIGSGHLVSGDQAAGGGDDDNDEFMPPKRISSSKCKSSRPASVLKYSEDFQGAATTQGPVSPPLDCDVSNTTSPPLVHLCKDRPKRPKSRPPTKPVRDSGEGNDWGDMRSGYELLQSGLSLGVEPQQQQPQQHQTIIPCSTSSAPTTPKSKKSDDSFLSSSISSTGIYAKKQQLDAVFNSPAATTSPHQATACDKSATPSSSSLSPVPALRIKKLMKSAASNPTQQQQLPLTASSNDPQLPLPPAAATVAAALDDSTSPIRNKFAAMTLEDREPSVVQSAPAKLRKPPQALRSGGGGGGGLMPSMQEIQQKRLTMKHVTDDEVPNIVVTDRSKRASDSNILRPTQAELSSGSGAAEGGSGTAEGGLGGSESQHKGGYKRGKLVPPPPPKHKRNSASGKFVSGEKRLGGEPIASGKLILLHTLIIYNNNNY
ncbi:hypothetical protein HELRODRAFT_194028 [Helobdella robusta]|uniref:CARMIL pleckstrin homology domain-containing protein n=1 Tax=Helobdella robusta TaxID=6412 RepID=T1FVL1_HELRO|nr:hypothetical protein HELRODRAFT_194028 [Helobdella robusta]ESN93479.1 hypothetical protein HELRODRAFT_194028 [Helobdella robusta]